MDLPVWNWWKFQESNDFSFLLKNKKDSICELAKEALYNLQSEFIENFGIDNKYREFLRLKCEIEIAYNKQILTGDRSSTLLIKVMERRLTEIFSKEKSSTYFTAVVAIEKFLGRKLDIRKESVYDVYNYINEIRLWQKARK